MSLDIRRYIKVYKNYYWPYLTRSLRTLPDFIIIGAQKAGTTSLYALLSNHPDIRMASTKEVWFFDKHFEKGLDWYRLNFPYRIKRCLNKRLIVGEASPSYVFNTIALRRIKATLPDVRIILLLRNPVNRAFSHYKHMKRNGRESSATFEEALELESSRVKEGYYEILENDKYRFLQAVNDFSYFGKGKYIAQVKVLKSIFSESQVLIVRSEDLFSKEQEALKKIYNFLNVSIPDPLNYPHFNFDDKGLEISPYTKKRLLEMYRDSILELEEYLNMKFNWEE